MAHAHTVSQTQTTPAAIKRPAAFVRWFDELTRMDAASVGGKGANLGELTRAQLPVPGGFAITSDAFLAALDGSGQRARMRELFEAAPVDDAAGLERASHELRELARGLEFPAAVRDAISTAYAALGSTARVAVRSSATSEDSGATSFAGMHETFTNVAGEQALLARVRDCWASAYGARVLAYRKSQNMHEEPVIAVVVQKMVDSQRSGVIFTADPSTGDQGTLVIEAAFGLGEVVVGGQVEVDTYRVSKATQQLRDVRVGRKAFKLARDAAGVEQRIELAPADAERRVLSDAEVQSLAQLAIAVEAHYGVPQDVEWAEEAGRFYLVQTRPITTLEPRHEAASQIVSGLAASPGVASGRVRVMRSPSQAAAFERGEVLVAEMTSPDWVPLMRRAAAVVTDSGGMTCHAAIVSRELGIPCVVGAREATKKLRDGDLVTVDARRGQVLAGAAHESTEAISQIKPVVQAQPQPAASEALATRIYVNLAMADQAES
ncbi:MAG TPA: PEP/pyruvate-binding domain-containing protein, partial [Polyangiales bacterium]|nr:PEP/pyruvate-binding domain-containing protein [Polyangiales bacterium]